MKDKFGVISLWLCCLMLGGFVILAIHCKRQESRIFELECSDHAQAMKIWRIQHPVMTASDSLQERLREFYVKQDRE